MIVDLLSKMEEIGFPISYMSGIKEVYFTYLKSNLEGDYNDEGFIRIGCNVEYLPRLHEILIHEVGHHIDAAEGASDEIKMLSEWRRKSGSFEHTDIKREPCEYFAIGFEKYHSPDHSSGDLTLKSHPILYRVVDKIHRKKVDR